MAAGRGVGVVGATVESLAGSRQGLIPPLFRPVPGPLSVAVAVFRQGLAIAVSALAASGGIASATAAAAAIISLALIQLIYDIRCKYSGLIAPVVLLLTACLCVSDGFFYVTVLFTALPNLFSSRMWRSRRRHSPSTKDNLFQPHSSAKKTCSPSWFTVT